VSNHAFDCAIMVNDDTIPHGDHHRIKSPKRSIHQFSIHCLFQSIQHPSIRRPSRRVTVRTISDSNIYFGNARAIHLMTMPSTAVGVHSSRSLFVLLPLWRPQSLPPKPLTIFLSNGTGVRLSFSNKLSMSLEGQRLKDRR
jgi:hypothetical protein